MSDETKGVGSGEKSKSILEKMTPDQLYGLELFFKYNPVILAQRKDMFAVADPKVPDFIPLTLEAIGTPKEEYIKTRVGGIFRQGLSFADETTLRELGDLGKDIREKEEVERKETLPLLKRIFNR